MSVRLAAAAISLTGFPLQSVDFKKTFGPAVQALDWHVEFTYRYVIINGDGSPYYCT